jgi:prepilin-type processing-associated H-X9-DG protein
MSWMTRLLPFIEQDNLWRVSQAAWQSNNWPWANPPHVGGSMVIPTYICAADYREMTAGWGEGYYIAFTGYQGVRGTDQHHTDGIFFADQTVSLRDVVDGTSNTLAVGERPPDFALWFGWWYAGAGMDMRGTGDVVLGVNEYKTGLVASGTASCPPGPYSFGPGSPSAECDMYHFWSMHDGGANFLFVDGSVHFLSYTTAPSVMTGLATRAGGEVLGDY